MRKLLALIILTFVVGACLPQPVPTTPAAAGTSSTSTGLKWRSPGAPVVSVDVVFLVPPTPQFAAAAVRATGVWNNRVPGLRLNYRATTSCSIANCIMLFRTPTNGAFTTRQTIPVATPSGVQWYITSANIWFDSVKPWTTSVLNNAFCHELGHAIGLDHGTSPGPCVGGLPTAHDTALANGLY